MLCLINSFHWYLSQYNGALNRLGNIFYVGLNPIFCLILDSTLRQEVCSILKLKKDNHIYPIANDYISKYNIEGNNITKNFVEKCKIREGSSENIAFDCEKRDFEERGIMKTEYNVTRCYYHKAQDKSENAQHASQFDGKVRIMGI
uniref:Uncharacterized protein n=1 Tax=Romanomermis culicivorax TaxID=13658 RepID=A0A915J374_ROMCU